MNKIETSNPDGYVTLDDYRVVTIDGKPLCYADETNARSIHGAIMQLHDTARDCAKVLHEQGFAGNELYQATLDNINAVLISLGIEPVIIRGGEVSQ